MSEHFLSPSFPWSMFSPDYPKPHVVSYEKIMFLSTFTLWFPRFQPSALNLAILPFATLAVLCYT